MQNPVFYEAFLAISWIKPRSVVTNYSECMRSNSVYRDSYVTRSQTLSLVCLCLAIHLTINERRNDDRSQCYTKYYFLSGNAWKITDFPNPFERFTNMSLFSFESCTLMHLPDLTFQIKTSSSCRTKLCTKIIYTLLQAFVLLLQISYQKKSFLTTPNIENQSRSSPEFHRIA